MADPQQILAQRKRQHETFWRGEGPSLIFVPNQQQMTYDLNDYPRRFEDPTAMWESEIARARSFIDWPTDGIPTVRPNLGVIFVPTLAGQDFEIHEGQMPWPGEPIGRDKILASRDVDVAEQLLMKRAAAFYELHKQKGGPDVAAYATDTQGVFDVAHLLYGDDLFVDMADPGSSALVDEVLEVCCDLYVRATRCLKQLMDEPDRTMIHGHATGQGLHFPQAGVRCSEDTAQLVSPDMIERYILPMVNQCSEPFGGCFVHYCGKHEAMFELMCNSPFVLAIDLGNPESYDPAWLFEQCARSDTVLYSRLPPEEGESWQDMLKRLGELVQSTGARCVLRPPLTPRDRDEAAAMQQMWHELTG
ncbi:MAG: hypothetical protein IT445_20625 [Phycisphaeraceae bacterium]|nr:hypothetical protein [Phycisphaeraceae bacterium]